MPPTHTTISQEINVATSILVEAGLADDQNFAHVMRVSSETYMVRHDNSLPFGSILRLGYEDAYHQYRDSRSFNVLMLDGAMVQMVYEFVAGRLARYRLAFLPSPDLLDFQNHPEVYLQEVLYADVVDKRVVTVPLRFDYDARPGVPVVLRHPVSHLTLGQYAGCRIPVTAGLTPYAFLKFVLDSFYSNAWASLAKELPAPSAYFDPCIEEAEKKVVHVSIPSHL